jgi:hypothetical protein
MIWLVGILILIAVTMVDCLTLAKVLSHGSFWLQALTFVCLFAGAAIGFWSSFFFRYSFGKDTEALGFPLPAMIFQWEDGHWVDYVGNPGLSLLGWFW